MLSIIAIVGQDSCIGSEGYLPEFSNAEERRTIGGRALELTDGGHLIIGSTTAKIMLTTGRWDGQRIGNRTVSIWTREYGVSVEQFILETEALNRPVFVLGGRTTFRLFAPYCEGHFILRAQLETNPGKPIYMPPILAEWAEATHRGTRQNH